VTPDRDSGGSPAGRTIAAPALRLASPADLPACGRIWRDALNDYMARLNVPLIPDDLASVGRFHAHLLATDPERFWIAVRPGDGTGGAEETVGFVSAVERGDLWFLSMLFVLPDEQGRGSGTRLLQRVLPVDAGSRVLATATDSAQPVSNALYSSQGIVPRMPLLSMVGRPSRADALEPLPAGTRAIPFEEIAAGPPDGTGHRRLVEAVDELDLELAGFTHPQDHRFLRMEGRRGFLYVGGTGELLGYGYASEAGRVGPVAVRDDALMGAVLGHLLTAVEPRGASALWVPGLADRAVVPLLAAGLRFDGFPVLLCWTRPFADFTRYIPISPGLP
jgi:GNAT superfamily N-acetyltransferase